MRIILKLSPDDYTKTFKHPFSCTEVFWTIFKITIQKFPMIPVSSLLKESMHIWSSKLFLCLFYLQNYSIFCISIIFWANNTEEAVGRGSHKRSQNNDFPSIFPLVMIITFQGWFIEVKSIAQVRYFFENNTKPRHRLNPHEKSLIRFGRIGNNSTFFLHAARQNLSSQFKHLFTLSVRK